MTTNTIYGIFDDEEVLLASVKEIRSNKIDIKEVYSPFPVHGLDKALGLKETSLYAWISQYRGEVLGANHDMTAEQELAALKKRAENIQQGLYVPLSSGHDSGLIAAELVHLGIGFHAYGFRYGDVIPPINNRS